ncbi:glycosyltransferase family 4 protein [Synechocystis sp. PCC 7509]|uniref:glycosyltransferase family 4 protein n=1 Tax=Synechocystis sp. PCC 7509 TaxID=927677 RepID=UPI0002ACE65B|nr:glycosyltransferase family 4 protein [Synechocystis sp. PCC 7509]
MKTLILSTSDIGGAGRAAYRLHQGLRGKGIESQMLVQDKFGDDTTVIEPSNKVNKGIAKLKPTLDKIPLQFYQQRDRTTYSVQWFPDKIATQVAQFNPDIVNLHWINEGFVQIETLAKLNKPIVWTLHDMWAFTGGCHYNQECDRFTKSCGECPQLHSHKNWDLSRWIWQRKAKAWQNLKFTIVTPSHWLAKETISSSLFQNQQVTVIPNGVDTQIYKPIDKKFARQILNLPEDKQLILFGAMNATSDVRKGFYLLQLALKNLRQSSYVDQFELVVFGASAPVNEVDLSFKTHYLGRLNDDISLSLVYSSSDVFVAPSLQDNLPNTVMESLACGTPCIAFNIGGMPEMIEHQKNGYLAQPFDTEDLAKGIVWVVENRERYQKLAARAREKVQQEFTLDLQAKRYLSLFNEITKI